MLPIFLVLCIASSQVLGAVILPVGDAAHRHAVHNDASAHSDASHGVEHTDKDYIYSFEKASEKAHSDGSAEGTNAEAYVSGHEGIAKGSGPGHFKAVYNNDYEKTYEQGAGEGHEETYSNEFEANKDAEYNDGVYGGAVASYNNYAPAAFPLFRGLHKRSAYYGYPGFYNNGYYGHNYHGYPAYHNYGYNHGLHKRSVYGAYPGYYNNGYYGNGYHNYGYPAFNHYGYNHGIHKRSVYGNYNRYPATYFNFGHRYGGFPVYHH